MPQRPSRAAKEVAKKRIRGELEPPQPFPAPKYRCTKQKEKPKDQRDPKPYLSMIKQAIKECDPNGTSDISIVRYIDTNYAVQGNFKSRIRAALARAVEGKVLNQRKRTYCIAKKKKKAIKKQTTPKKTDAKGKNKKQRTDQKKKTDTSTRKKKRSIQKKDTSSRKQKSKKSHKKSEESDSGELVWVWQYLENDGYYYNYHVTASNLVESVYQDYLSNPRRVDVNAVQSGEWKYMVDFKNMTQQNIQHEKHTTRNIRRHQIPDSLVFNMKKAWK